MLIAASIEKLQEQCLFLLNAERLTDRFWPKTSGTFGTLNLQPNLAVINDDRCQLDFSASVCKALGRFQWRRFTCVADITSFNNSNVSTTLCGSPENCTCVQTFGYTSMSLAFFFKFWALSLHIPKKELVAKKVARRELVLSCTNAVM